jgi:hypothetical protein
MKVQIGLMVAALVAGALPSRAATQVPIPTLEGPVTGGKGSPSIGSTTFDLSLVGYSEAEYFIISGTASAYSRACGGRLL